MKVALTGGGTAGHVMPNIALDSELRAGGHKTLYIGTSGMEKQLVERASIEFHEISSGKLRRYFSVQNFWDMFRVLKGVWDAWKILKTQKPDVVFSKGGFVAVPTAIAAWVLRIPLVTHESDLSPGLATRIIAFFAKEVLTSFSETAGYLKGRSVKQVIAPIRPEIFNGKRDVGYEMCGFKDNKPVILFMGGSLGAKRLNEMLEAILPILVQTFNVVHLTGKGKSIGFKADGYRAFEFLHQELPDVFALSDLVVTRAGSNSIFEMLVLRKPMLLVPLKIGSRGDQVLNAECFQKRNFAAVIDEETMTPESLLHAIRDLNVNSKKMQISQESFSVTRGSAEIVKILEGLAYRSR